MVSFIFFPFSSFFFSRFFFLSRFFISDGCGLWGMEEEGREEDPICSFFPLKPPPPPLFHLRQKEGGFSYPTDFASLHFT